MSKLLEQPPGLFGRLVGCPFCHADGLLPVSDGETVNFLCERCGSCWHVEFGYVRRVDPRSCRGCAHRDVCIGRLTSRF
jgi:transposase-like protein